MLRFVPNDVQGMPQRRSHARACEICRRRKKRCYHGSDAGASSQAEVQHGQGSSKRSKVLVTPDLSPNAQSSSFRAAPAANGIEQGQISSLRHGRTLSATANLPADAEAGLDNVVDRPSTASGSHAGTYASNDTNNESRFIGHLNPEGAFLVATSPTNNTASGRPEEVGVWLPAKNQSGTPRQYPPFSTSEAQQDEMYCPNPIVADLLLPHLQGPCLSLLPESTDLEALCDIYFDEFHPLFPILDRQLIEEPPSHVFSRIAIRQIVCLIASSCSTAEPYLSLPINGTHTKRTRSEFARQISLAVRTAVNLELIRDKLILCQICTLFSLHTQLADDRHLSVELCSRAIAHAQTLGLHLPTRADQPNAEVYKRVFCCIWTLDRLNAAFQGRPVTMHERDSGIDLRATFASQDSCFRLSLHTTLLLDKVIDLYRPKADGSERDWGPDFPDFESIVHDAGALRVKHNLLAIVEIYYHAIAMLSHRSQSVDQPLPRSPSYLRQGLSAHRVLSIVSEELKPQLSPIPIVPYAVSVALRFFYREFRYTKVPHFRARAQKQLLLGSSILRYMGEAFPAAAGIADMVKQTLKETEKVYSSMAQPEENERETLNGQPEANVVAQPPVFDVDGEQQPGSGSTWDSATWESFPLENLSDIDVFQHFDPNFNLDAIDAALADDTQPVFPMTFDNLWF